MIFDKVINTRTRTICTYVYIRAEKYGKYGLKWPFRGKGQFRADKPLSM